MGTHGDKVFRHQLAVPDKEETLKVSSSSGTARLMAISNDLASDGRCSRGFLKIRKNSSHEQTKSEPHCQRFTMPPSNKPRVGMDS